jgi:hypothetical protein
MSILIIGADRIGALVTRLEEVGVSRVTHWSARNSKSARNTIPSHVELVVFFTDFLHHSVARKLKSQVKQLGLPALYCRRCWSELGGQLNNLQ